ncbi:MAG: hypothetical protein K2H01_02475 [Ruminococcus sp.]|nr:hypothetical protein [Ruminococcus sp.]
MTAIFLETGGTEYILRNFTKFNESYSENIKKFESESGRAIIYPIRSGKRCIALTIEANSVYLNILKNMFNQPVIHLKYTHGSDADTDCIGNIKQQIHEADFIKTGNITIKQIADIKAAIPNAGMKCSYGKLGYYDRFGRGAYEFSVTLEEI